MTKEYLNGAFHEMGIMAVQRDRITIDVYTDPIICKIRGLGDPTERRQYLERLNGFREQVELPPVAVGRVDCPTIVPIVEQ